MPIRRPPATALTGPTQADLTRRQKKASTYAVRDKAIGTAWKGFSGTAARREVARRLAEVFDAKCAYCEIVVPRDIEHFYPKSKYPKRMFQWDNFLLACKNCNTDKLDTFTPLLLDPCSDDPADFVTWDLDSGLPMFAIAANRRRRAETTVKLFHLDNQQLCEERKARATTFRFLLLQCIERRPTPRSARDWLLAELAPTRPWRSVLRQIVRDPAYSPLVLQVKRAVPAAAALLEALAA